MKTNRKTYEELFKKIDHSVSIAELYSLDAVPPINFSGDFFFVSYSHEDYRAIYKDIFLFQQNKLNIWFDRGMKPGSDWLENAEHFISQFACKGIIIYLSPNSFSSKAVLEEIRLSLIYRKPLIPVVLHKTDLVDGNIAKTFLSRALLSKEEEATIEKAFNSRVLYLEMDSPIESKVNYINNAKDETKLLEIVDINRISSPVYLNSRAKATGKMLTQCNDPYCIRVKLPVEVNYIGDATFTNMANLREIDLSKVKEIDSYAFADCRQLKEVDLSALKHLGDSSFERSGVESILFPHFKTLKEKMDDFDSIDLEEAYGDDDSAIEEDFQTLREGWMVEDEGATGEGELTLPNEDEDEIEPYFGKNAFASCLNLREVSLIETYPYVPEGCFHDCANLTKVVLDGPSSIGNRAFYNCKNLQEVVFKAEDTPLKIDENGGFSDADYLLWKEKKMKVIGDFAFENCVSLKGFRLPSSLDSIGKAAFKGANIDARIIKLYCTLGEQAFMNAPIRSIVFAGKTTNIADEVCRGCQNLEKVDFYEPTMAIGNSSFRDCPSLEMVTIPSLSLGKSAFSHSGLSYVRLQPTVRDIGPYAFSTCLSLSYLYIESEELKIHEKAFFDCGHIRCLILPKKGRIDIDYRALEDTYIDFILYSGSRREYESGQLLVDLYFLDEDAPHFLNDDDAFEYLEDREMETKGLRHRLKRMFDPRNLYFLSPSKIEGERSWRFADYSYFPEVLIFE